MSRVSVLRNVALFAGLSDQELEVPADRLGKRTFGKGMIIFHKDSPRPKPVYHRVGQGTHLYHQRVWPGDLGQYLWPRRCLR